MTAEHTRTALAQIVRPETMEDIEEFLRPQFPPKKKEVTDGGDPFMGMRRRIVMDGHGRWREVRGEEVSTSVRLIDSRNLPQMKQQLHIQSPTAGSRFGSKTFPQASRYGGFQERPLSRTSPGRGGSRVGKRPSEDQYSHLGMTTRSNVFPGLGNFQWNSTTAKTFTEKPVTPVQERHHFFGIQTDDFGQWSAANVHHERMKKAWEEYLATAPKPAANWKPPEPRAAPVPHKPQSKPKKTPHKPKPPKKEQGITPADNLQEQPKGPPSKLPPDVPVDNDDDDFWEFFDKPFNKPR
ncbi:uncharacterized protein LOC116604821 [Nematostella vectensis]|uniref:uncharacterized protein LOC116604821 n=1 Tax=Nematostella vectensis TaxID=45351 RepID=UPI0013902DC2|nr:uncharacterized protein LOC116604821 [Nematostella vectensis]